MTFKEMTRTTQEVFDSHREALETLNFEQLMADYADDAILLTLNGSFIGKESIGVDFFQNILTQFSNLKIAFEKTAVEGDTFMLQYSAEADEATVPLGTASFIIQDGKIQRQVEWFEIVPREG